MFRSIRLFICWMVAALLLWGTGAAGLAEEAAPSASPAPDAVAASAIADDGVLRVWLQSLDDPQSLDLCLMGAYAVEDDAASASATARRSNCTPRTAASGCAPAG